MECRNCIFCESYNEFMETVLCSNGGKHILIPFSCVCEGFQKGKNKYRERSEEFFDWLGSLCKEELKQAHSEIEEFCENGVVPGNNSVMGKWIQRGKKLLED